MISPAQKKNKLRLLHVSGNTLEMNGVVWQFAHVLLMCCTLKRTMEELHSDLLQELGADGGPASGGEKRAMPKQR